MPSTSDIDIHLMGESRGGSSSIGAWTQARESCLPCMVLPLLTPIARVVGVPDETKANANTCIADARAIAIAKADERCMALLADCYLRLTVQHTMSRRTGYELYCTVQQTDAASCEASTKNMKPSLLDGTTQR